MTTRREQAGPSGWLVLSLMLLWLVLYFAVRF